MEWSTLVRIPTEQLSGTRRDEAMILNRRMDDLEAYRKVSGTIRPPRGGGRPGTAVDEALRREVVLRTDVARYDAAAARTDVANAAALRAVQELLKERGTHTHAN